MFTIQVKIYLSLWPMGDWFTGLPVMEKGGTGVRTGSKRAARCRPQ